MMMQSLALLFRIAKPFGVAAICGLIASPSIASPAQPTNDPLIERVENLSWLRDRFLDDPAAKSRWARIQNSAAASRKLETSKIREELVRKGVKYPSPEDWCYSDGQCRAISRMTTATDRISDINTFDDAIAKVRPLANGYIMALANTERWIASRSDDPLAEQLANRVLWDQNARAAVAHMYETYPPIILSSNESALLSAMIASYAFTIDEKNTVFVKALIDQKGWPRISVYGQSVSSNVWLLVQHADDDPAFQLDALKKMAELPASEASAQLHGLLYDRVMLVLTGKQKYGSQFECKAHKMVVRPLEDPEKLDEFRREAQMLPISEYAKKLPSSC